jgi:hypothetical protein
MFITKIKTEEPSWQYLETNYCNRNTTSASCMMVVVVGGQRDRQLDHNTLEIMSSHRWQLMVVVPTVEMFMFEQWT